MNKSRGNHFENATTETARNYMQEADEAQRRAALRPHAPIEIMRRGRAMILKALRPDPDYAGQCECWLRVADLMRAVSNLTHENLEAIVGLQDHWRRQADARFRVNGLTEQMPAGLETGYRAAMGSAPALAAVLAEDDRLVAEQIATREADQRAYEARIAEAADTLAEGRKAAPKLIADLVKRGVVFAHENGALVVRGLALMNDTERASVARYSIAVREIFAEAMVFA